MQLSKNRIGNVVGRNVVSGTVDRGFDQATDYKICISGFSAKQTALRERAKTGWVEIRIMCQGRAKCLPADCSCSSELAL